jgi:hypothetical protein
MEMKMEIGGKIQQDLVIKLNNNDSDTDFQLFITKKK